jgi:uncharacterized protein YbjT (DUF2867 family)
MNTSLDPRPTLVVPGAGLTGSRVTRRLTEAGHPVRALSRSTSPAFDWTRPADWPAVLAGTRAAYLAYVPDIAVPGSAEALAEFGRLAAEAGIERLVLLSGRGESEAELAEASLRTAGVPTAVLRSNWFAQNFTDGFLAELTIDGVLALPAGEVVDPFTDIDDLAEAAVSLLTRQTASDDTFVVSGARALSFADAVAELSAATGDPVRFVEVSMADFLAGLEAYEVPSDYRELLAYLFGEVLDGRNSIPGAGIEQVLGRPATDFADFARRSAAERLTV